MPDIEPAIKWMTDRRGKVTYSMDSRKGPNSYDCSSSVYYSLVAGGFFPIGIYIGNTDTLFGDLEKYGWAQLQPNAQGNFDTQRGDVFIWGTRGRSTGAIGHTGEFIDADRIIHCSYGYNGITESNYDWLHQINGWPVATYYRYVGNPTPVATEPVDQVVNPGSYIEFPDRYRVDDVQDIADVWQVRNDRLCPIGFNWAENGIPAYPLVEVDNDGFATNDQVLDIGAQFVIPGKYQVLDVGQSDGRWLGQIEMQGMGLWVDLEPVKEVGAGDSGTPTPGPRPQSQPITTTTTEVPHGTTTSTTVVPTVTTTTTTGTATTSTTIAPEPATTTTSTTIATPDLSGIDLETNGGNFPGQEFALGFWAAFFAALKLFAKATWNRLRGIQ